MIKVLVDMRHTGKSMLMRLFMQYLLSAGVNASSMYYRRFND